MINHQKLQKDFQKLIEKSRLSHAYLFFGGDAGSEREKLLFAESLANFLESGIFEKPKKLLTETLLIEKDEEGKIGIDAVRNIRHFLYQKPIASKYRTLIIGGADLLTREAKNAILKIVEEPPESALIIFIVNQEDNLSPALVSRLQRIYFAPKTDSSETGVKAKIRPLTIEGATDDIDVFFEDLIAKLRKDPVKNVESLKASLGRLTLIKQWNTNKRLQLKSLLQILESEGRRKFV